jgi:hypothetical protein
MATKNTKNHKKKSNRVYEGRGVFLLGLFFFFLRIFVFVVAIVFPLPARA